MFFALFFLKERRGACYMCVSDCAGAKLFRGFRCFVAESWLLWLRGEEALVKAVKDILVVIIRVNIKGLLIGSRTAGHHPVPKFEASASNSSKKVFLILSSKWLFLFILSFPTYLVSVFALICLCTHFVKYLFGTLTIFFKAAAEAT